MTSRRTSSRSPGHQSSTKKKKLRHFLQIPSFIQNQDDLLTFLKQPKFNKFTQEIEFLALLPKGEPAEAPNPQWNQLLKGLEDLNTSVIYVALSKTGSLSAKEFNDMGLNTAEVKGAEQPAPNSIPEGVCQDLGFNVIESEALKKLKEDLLKPTPILAPIPKISRDLTKDLGEARPSFTLPSFEKCESGSKVEDDSRNSSAPKMIIEETKSNIANIAMEEESSAPSNQTAIFGTELKSELSSQSNQNQFNQINSEEQPPPFPDQEFMDASFADPTTNECIATPLNCGVKLRDIVNEYDEEPNVIRRIYFNYETYQKFEMWEARVQYDLKHFGQRHAEQR